MAAGRPVPHVTAVLAACRMAQDFSELPPLARQRALWKRGLGTAVHMDCHAYDDGDLDWSTVDESVKPYVEAWAQAKESLGWLRPLDRERHVFDHVYWYTGILDGVFLRDDGMEVLADIKTGDPSAAAGDLQTGAYAKARQRMTGKLVGMRLAIWLRPGKRIPYAVFPYVSDIEMDHRTFLACLTVYREQERRGRLKIKEEE